MEGEVFAEAEQRVLPEVKGNLRRLAGPLTQLLSRFAELVKQTVRAKRSYKRQVLYTLVALMRRG